MEALKNMEQGERTSPITGARSSFYFWPISITENLDFATVVFLLDYVILSLLLHKTESGVCLPPLLP